MNKNETSIEVTTKHQQARFNTIQSAFKQGQQSTIVLFYNMWTAGKAAITLRDEGFTQVAIAERAKVPQPFICYSIRLHRKFSKFTLANPPRALRGKTMNEVWHEVLVRKHHSKSTQPPTEPTPLPVPTPLPTPSPPAMPDLPDDIDEGMKKLLQPYLEAEYVSRLHNIATEYNYTVTELVARLIVMSIKNNSNSQVKAWLPPKSAPPVVQVPSSA